MHRLRVGLCATILFAIGVLQVWWPVIMQSSKAPAPDVIVVGGGLAGLCAAIAADREGARVAIIDKENRLGGNSAKASSGMNGVGGDQNDRGDEGDSIEAFVKDTIASGQRLSDEGLVNALVRESMQAIKFLESFGVNLDVRGRCGGHSFARTYRNGPPKEGERFQNVGFHIISKLTAYVERRPNISKIVGARVTRLIIAPAAEQNTEKVVGVVLKYADDDSEVDLMGSAVVLTTGGYGANVSGFHEGSVEFKDLPTTNGQFAVGDGLLLAQKVGAAVKGMDHVQVHPTSFVDSKDVNAGTNFLAAESLRGSGGLLVNQNGKRFTNELGRRDEVTEAMKTHGSALDSTNRVFAYLLLNSEARDRVGPAFGFYEFKGFFKKYNDANVFAKEVGMDSEALAQTLEDYRKVAGSAEPDEFGKSIFPVAFQKNDIIYAAQVTPAIHYTMGGLAFSKDGEILDENGAPIRGLYGAGEVTGGLHGANRLGGNSLLECVVFGRAAGSKAASFAKH
ncbi:hypothetical protein BSKO_08908 [Bryopsis sp. KO-2023]|nr:hypothetical protein BSKO_08908 [Bryopsis sp. KO-2023]